MARLFKEMMILALAGIALLYLTFPTFGVFELIPDIIPIIGNLDEAGAVLILINTLAYYGIDLSRIYGRAERKPAQLPPPPPRQQS